MFGNRGGVGVGVGVVRGERSSRVGERDGEMMINQFFVGDCCGTLFF